MEERDYDKLAARALVDFREYVAELRGKFANRERYRLKAKIPRLFICGHGRHGKDETANVVSVVHGLGFASSVSSFVLPLVAAALEVPRQEAWDSRHNCREFWFNFCNSLRKSDPSLLVQMVLGSADIVSGVRAMPEIDACFEKGWVDRVIWVERPGFPEDPTLDYDLEHLRQRIGEEHLDQKLQVIINDGDLSCLQKKVASLPLKFFELSRREVLDA
jgi:hypothetical protein